MKKKRLLIVLCIILFVIVIGLCTWRTAKVIWTTEDESLRWTKMPLKHGPSSIICLCC